MHISADDILVRISENDLIVLTNAHGAATQVDMPTLVLAIEEAESALKEAVSGIYDFPLSAVSAKLKGALCDIVLYNLHSREITDKMPENIVFRYKDATAYLDKIRSRKITLEADLLTVAKSTSAVYCTSKPEDRVFSRYNLRHM